MSSAQTQYLVANKLASKCFVVVGLGGREVSAEEVEHLLDPECIASDVMLHRNAAMFLLKKERDAAQLADKITGYFGAASVLATTLDKYLVLSQIGKRMQMEESADLARGTASPQGAEQPGPLAVKKVAGRNQVLKWRAATRGEQFVLCSDKALVNYELEKMKPPKITATKKVQGLTVSVERDILIGKRQKTLFLYGGLLELLDAHVPDWSLGYELVNEHLLLRSQPRKRTLWTAHHIYTKRQVLELEGDEVMLSEKATHCVRRTGSLEEVLRVKDLSVFLRSKQGTGNGHSLDADGKTPDLDRKNPGSNRSMHFSRHANMLVAVQKNAHSARIALYDLDTEARKREKTFTNMGECIIEFAEQEVCIVYSRAMAEKKTYCIDIWSNSGAHVLSKALGEGIREIHSSSKMVATLGNTHAKIFKRVQGRILEGVAVKGHFGKAALREVGAFLGDDRVLLVNADGAVLKEVPASGIECISWSPFGLYLALLGHGQISVLDLAGKEVFSTNAAQGSQFFWRSIPLDIADVEVTSEDVSRFRKEDSIKKKETKEQKKEVSKEQEQEWRSFLERMMAFYISNMQ